MNLWDGESVILFDQLSAGIDNSFVRDEPLYPEGTMNPYAQPAAASDIAIAWVFTALWLGIGICFFRLWDQYRDRRAVSYFASAGEAFVWLCGAIAPVFAIGVFLRFGFVSPLWWIWEVLCGLAAMCVFRVFPIAFLAIVVGINLTSRNGGSWVRLCAACLVGITVDVVFYFGLVFALR